VSYYVSFLILGSWLSPGLTTAFPPAPNWGPKGWGVDDPDSTTAERPAAAFPFTGSARPCREPHQAAPLIEQIASLDRFQSRNEEPLIPHRPQR
jgi:hypothetical protein